MAMEMIWNKHMKGWVLMKKTALVLIDLQNDYFKGGDWELKGTAEAADNAKRLLDKFREKGDQVIHVRHEATSSEAPFFRPGSEGAKIHEKVAPMPGEPVVLKHQINSFRDTNLKEVLQASEIEKVVVCGAMSHMCVDAVTRAAYDFGYTCLVAHDACATLDLTFGGLKVPAEYVHAAFMAALDFAYADVKSTEEVLALI